MGPILWPDTDGRGAAAGRHGRVGQRPRQAELRPGRRPFPGPPGHAPALPERPGAVRWMGCRPSMPDSLPVLGRSPVHRSVYFAFGHGHLGLTGAAASGRIIADLVAQRAGGQPVRSLSRRSVLITRIRVHLRRTTSRPVLCSSRGSRRTDLTPDVIEQSQRRREAEGLSHL